MTVFEFLESKPLFYKKIDYAKMPQMWHDVSKHFPSFKIIHIIGTNGKGSTGRFLAQMLHSCGFNVGHYTSPHIFRVNERFWLNSSYVSDEQLNQAHLRLLSILPRKYAVQSSYFEYATLLSAVLFANTDYFVCEAGMGGEKDATNVFDKILSLFTPIGYDHTDVLGSTLNEICYTKLNAMCDNAIINDSMDKQCLEIAGQIANNKGVNLKLASEMLNEIELKKIQEYSRNFNLARFLNTNLTLASAAFKFLLPNYSLNSTLDLIGELKLRGRIEKISKNIYIDVGHNAMAAKALADKFKDEKITLIYNSFADKDFASVLNILSSVIDSVFVYDFNGDGRLVAGFDNIKPICEKLKIPCFKFEKLNLEKKYLVFGSFHLVEAFLKEFSAGKSL